MTKVIKRNGKKETFKLDKVKQALKKAYMAEERDLSEHTLATVLENVKKLVETLSTVNVEIIQDCVERSLMISGEYEILRAYITYRDKHKQMRDVEGLIEERVQYINDYISSSDNAATSSETDPNANVSIKNVANIDGEVYKVLNRPIQRYRMRKKLRQIYPEVEYQYEKDLESHIIYAHDEASAPTVKNYCEAVTLYPLVQSGTKAMDGLGTTPPHCLSSFCGQLVNVTFLLAAQCKGAVAFGELFNFLDYFCTKDFGPDYHKRTSELASTTPRRSIGSAIHQAYQQIVYGWNQPAGNRSYQSPFTNISYYDKNYWHALFEDFCFPDGTKPEWERVDFLQKDFIQWFNKERTKALLTFPVETMALLTDGKDVLDQDYKDFTAEMYAKGHSFFTYLSDNPNALASCCRLRNEIDENAFSFSTGLTGVQTGSANVITLNLNRIIQNWAKELITMDSGVDENGNGPSILDIKNNVNLVKHIRDSFDCENFSFKQYLIDILERIYKYHIAYKQLLYEVEEKGMLNASTAGYISMKRLYSTIGLNGVNEAAEFLGIKCNYNSDYIDFCRLITGIISKQNKLHSKPNFKFNTEFVPAESLGSRNYNWDKKDGYWVSEDRNLYNSYFYIASDPESTILDKIKMHGREFTSKLDGGVGCHLNLEDHLSKSQYLKVINFAIQEGCTYFTFNIPNSSCDNDKCGFITKHPMDKCPKCGSTMTQYTRVIGYLRAIKSFGKDRQIEAKSRYYDTPKKYEI